MQMGIDVNSASVQENILEDVIRNNDLPESTSSLSNSDRLLEKIQKNYDWSTSLEFKFSSRFESDIDKIIRRIDSDFKVLNKERKIKRLHNYRAKSEKAKKNVLEHGYDKSTSKGKINRLKNGSTQTLEVRKVKK